MSSEEDSGIPSASGLITYIGVPLTIMSLLPLAYNAVVTLVHLHRVKRELKRSHIKARFHSDIFNRLVEIELPKYIIRPPQSSQNTRSNDDDFFRSSITGGSWTFLKWERQEYGTRTQRTQPGDALRQPQARVLFWDLISRFYELGGLPDGKGWQELHDRPLWAEGRSLMVLENQRGSSLELQVASSRDSDGTMSLKLVHNGPHVDWTLENGGQGITRPGTITLPLQNLPGEPTSDKTSIFCRITRAGLKIAFPDPKTGDNLDTEHLQIRGSEGRQGIWFASCAAALNVQSQTPILEYQIPDDIRQLAMTDSIPDGIVKLVYGIETMEVPSWVTVYHLSGKKLNHEEGGGLDPQNQTELMGDDARVMKQCEYSLWCHMIHSI